MKKLFISLTVFVFFLVPFGVFAAVNISLEDSSAEDANSVSININTETDVLEQVILPISFSDGVTVTDVTEGTVKCPTLEYSNSADNTIIIKCELEETTALDGTLATILFTATEEGYSFEVSEDDENLDIGNLTLGDVTDIINIGPAQEEETTEPSDEATTQEDETEDTIPFGDDTLVTTQEGMPLEQEEGNFLQDFNLDNITEYLPYILIGGSVILLISIIAILLGNKKKPETTKKSKKTPSKRTPPQPPTRKEDSQGESSLKSMVNSVESTTKQAPTQTPPQRPTPQTQPPAQPFQQQPPTQRTSSPQISPKTEEEDLQEILKREGTQTPPEEQQQNQEANQVPFNAGLNTGPQSTPSNQNVNATTPQPQTPPENPETPMQENPTFKNPDQELQENINREINQIKRTTPSVETPKVVPPDKNPPATDLNTGSLPSQPSPTPSNEYPPVPPTAQQGPPVAQTPEELPETPPTM
jgi:hypothetical protein